jgi:cation diffusion facilitator family transporter
VVAGVGAAYGLAWVDPVAGLVVAVPILWLLIRSARRIFRRLIDGVEPEMVDTAASVIAAVDGVSSVEDLRVRWHGHQLRLTASISVDGALSVKEGHDIAHTVEHELHHAFPTPVVVTIHVEPSDHPDRHDITEHHAKP